MVFDVAEIYGVEIIIYRSLKLKKSRKNERLAPVSVFYVKPYMYKFGLFPC